MRWLKVMYFFLFAVGGSVGPVMSLYFLHKGLTMEEIGFVQAFSSTAIILTPVLLTFLADTRLDARRITAISLILSSIALASLHLVSGFSATMLVWTASVLTYIPLSTLMDGITFSVMQRRQESGLAVEPYHRVRVWGSVGFILPSMILYFTLRYIGITSILIVGTVFGVVAAAIALLLPNPRRQLGEAPSRLPTIAAARRMFRGPLLVFCIASFLLNAASAAHYTFYPIYLTERLHIDKRWAALISNIGVVVEIFFMLGFAWLLSRWGLKRLMIVGACCLAARMVLLAAVPTPAVAIGTQLFHGVIILMLLVAPPVYLNQHAEDEYRHSMQGLYAMLVFGVGRVAGNLIASPIARKNLLAVYASGAGLCLVAIGLLIFAFRDEGKLAAVAEKSITPFPDPDEPAPAPVSAPGR
jgi:MFS transporter, PPP family, 3-phenylpropionic acid transporter